ESGRRRSLTSALVPRSTTSRSRCATRAYLSLFGFGKEFKAKKELAAIASEVIQLNSHLNQLKADQAGGIGYFGNAEKVAAQIANVTRELDTAKKKFREANAAYLGLTDGSAGGGRGFVNPEVVKPVLTALDLEEKPKAGKTPKARTGSGTDLGFDFEPSSEAQRQAVKLIEARDLSRAQEYTAALQVLNEALRAASSEEMPALQSAIAQLGEQYKDVSEVGPLLPPELLERAQRLNELLAETPTEKIEKQRQDMQLLADAFERGTISAEQFSEAAQARLGTLPETIKKSSDAMTVFGEEASRNIQDAFGDTLAKTLQGDFDSIGELWKNLLLQMAAEAIAADLAKSIFGDGAGGGGWLGSLFGAFSGASANAKGNAFGSTGIQAFGQGDIFNSPTLFRFAQGGGFSLGVMGEAGPEAVMPLRRGRDGKLGVAAQQGRSPNVTIVQHMSFGAGVNRAELAAWGEQVRRQTLTEVHRSVNRNGSLS
ncbi:hypothetical protein OOT46_29210, partial [Aquabacterium sp. A7-Y]|nr:hypothetical protein [Aquabacterium sp. A7-Y]